MSTLRVARAACAVILVTAASCRDEGSRDTAGPYAVGTRSLDLADESRPTPAFGGSPALPTRTIVTELWYPAEGPADGAAIPDAPPAKGPFPLIVFNHGQQGEPRQYSLAFERWAMAGYIVAAPRHPISVLGGPGGQFVDDAEGETGDIPFTITMVEEELPDLVDEEQVAVAGHSSGALTSLAVGFGECCRDDRVGAVLLEGVPSGASVGERGRGTPVMFIHGTNDLNPVEQARGAFDSAAPPKLLLVVEGGDHSAMYRDGPQAGMVADAALAFFDFTLKDRDDALERVQAIPGLEAVLE